MWKRFFFVYAIPFKRSEKFYTKRCCIDSIAQQRYDCYKIPLRFNNNVIEVNTSYIVLITRVSDLVVLLLNEKFIPVVDAIDQFYFLIEIFSKSYSTEILLRNCIKYSIYSDFYWTAFFPVYMRTDSANIYSLDHSNIKNRGLESCAISLQANAITLS